MGELGGDAADCNLLKTAESQPSSSSRLLNLESAAANTSKGEEDLGRTKIKQRSKIWMELEVFFAFENLSQLHNTSKGEEYLDRTKIKDLDRTF